MYVSYEKLFQWMRENRMPQKEFSEVTGIQGGTLQKLRRNEHVTTKTICTICEKLYLHPNDILEWKDEAESIQAKQQAKIDALQRELDVLKKEVRHE